MLRKSLSLMLLAMVCLLAFGCSQEPVPVESADSQMDSRLLMSAIVAPAGGVFQSATLYVYVGGATDQTVNVHRVTSSWDEMTVTWNSFGGAYSGAVSGSFTSSAGWQSVDVTALVSDWMDGTNDNFGVLLDQVDMTWPRTLYHSRENATNQPFVEFCWSTSSGPVCEVTPVIADTYIYERSPDANRGGSDFLFTGWQWDADMEKQALLMFEMPEDPPDDYGDCEGKVTQLTLQYNGSTTDAHVVIVQRTRGRSTGVAFDGIVQPGDQFTFSGIDRHGTLGPEIDVYINGAYHTYIHTSCSQPIGPGLVRGDFLVIEGYSRGGGLLAPL